MSEKKFLKIKLQDGETILSQQNHSMYLRGWQGYLGKIITTNTRVVFVKDYLILGWIFKIFFPRTKIDISLPYSKISTSIGKHFRSQAVFIIYNQNETTSKEYKFIIKNPENWLVEVDKNINTAQGSSEI